MKQILILLSILLIVSNASAEQFEFRGRFVETYITAPGFTATLPPEVKLYCKGGVKNGRRTYSDCSVNKSVRVYVFENENEEIWVWSAHGRHLQYDDERMITGAGVDGHIVYFDEHKQMISRSHVLFDENQKLLEEIAENPAPTTTELNKQMYELEKLHDAELKKRFEKESEKYYKNTRRPPED